MDSRSARTGVQHDPEPQGSSWHSIDWFVFRCFNSLVQGPSSFHFPMTRHVCLEGFAHRSSWFPAFILSLKPLREEISWNYTWLKAVCKRSPDKAVSIQAISQASIQLAVFVHQTSVFSGDTSPGAQRLLPGRRIPVHGPPDGWCTAPTKGS